VARWSVPAVAFPYSLACFYWVMGFMMAMLSYYGGERINELWATLALAWVEHGEARINLLGKPYP